jgi:hypothetical protein
MRLRHSKVTSEAGSCPRPGSRPVRSTERSLLPAGDGRRQGGRNRRRARRARGSVQPYLPREGRKHLPERTGRHRSRTDLARRLADRHRTDGTGAKARQGGGQADARNPVLSRAPGTARIRKAPLPRRRRTARTVGCSRNCSACSSGQARAGSSSMPPPAWWRRWASAWPARGSGPGSRPRRPP